MPSPLGHALGGIAAGVAVGRSSGPADSSGRARIAVFAVLGAAADLDLLFGTHSTYSHSIGAVGAIAVLAAVFLMRQPGRWTLVAALAAAYASHLALDWFNTDYASPVGIMALWPFSTAHYHAGFAIFPPVSRDFGAAWFLPTNAWAATFEILVLGPLALLAVRRRT